MDTDKLIEKMCAFEDEIGVTLPLIVTRVEYEALCVEIRKGGGALGAYRGGYNTSSLDYETFGVRLDGTLARVSGSASDVLAVFRGRAVVRACKASDIKPATIAEYNAAQPTANLTAQVDAAIARALEEYPGKALEIVIDVDTYNQLDPKAQCYGYMPTGSPSGEFTSRKAELPFKRLFQGFMVQPVSE